MAQGRAGLDAHEDLVPLFATRAEIAELREKVMSLQTVVRALAAKQGADANALADWALCMTQFNSESGRALATAQSVAQSLARPAPEPAPVYVPPKPNDAF